jgi:hypothetical protein
MVNGNDFSAVIRIGNCSRSGWIEQTLPGHPIESVYISYLPRSSGLISSSHLRSRSSCVSSEAIVWA